MDILKMIKIERILKEEIEKESLGRKSEYMQKLREKREKESMITNKVIGGL